MRTEQNRTERDYDGDKNAIITLPPFLTLISPVSVCSLCVEARVCLGINVQYPFLRFLRFRENVYLYM